MYKVDYDIIIIGAGTAGMTAAIYGFRSGKYMEGRLSVLLK